jgi:hypothetical protein
MFSMSRRTTVARQLRTLAACVAILCAGAFTIVHGRPLERPATPPQRFFEGRAFAAALPAALRPPTLDPGLRLVSMVAADIDADGDLDVVASDGSLDLVVWTNDGTGRLTRKYPAHSSGGLDEPPAQTLDQQESSSVSALPPGGDACCAPPTGRLGLVVITAGVVLPPSAPARVVASVRTPRAPPASIA